MKNFLKSLPLKYSSKQMEQEYIVVKQQTNIENIQTTFYCLICFIMIPAIPAIIKQEFVDVGVAITAGVFFVLIYFFKMIPKNCTQFLAALIVCSFNFLTYFLHSCNFEKLSKGITFYHGYAYGCLHGVLLSRFANLWQKIFFLGYSYALRFLVIPYFDPNSLNWYGITRHIYVDLFVIYVNYMQERKERNVFKRFYEYREELIKFKELLADYLPQGLTVLSSQGKKSLFSNKAFKHQFDHSEDELDEFSGLQLQSQVFKPYLNFLQVDKDTLREVGAAPSCVNPSGSLINLKDMVEELVKCNLLESKALSISAFQSNQDQNKSYDVIMTKIKWDGEDAIAVILNDITYQADLITLKVSDANKDKLIATVSHELRTPLNGIIGILEMIENKVTDNEVIEYLGLCKDNAHLLLSLVNSLLDLHQVRQGKLRLNIIKANIKKVLEEVVRLFAFQCNRKGIYLKLNFSEEVPNFVCTDEKRLMQILINLIGNAFKFTSHGGITINVCQDPVEPECLEISVADTGIGIRKEDQSKLFQMYEKLEYGRTVNKHGVGLGLTIANTLVCLLSGKKEERAIQVVSEVNNGSKFSFRILKDLKDISAEFDNSPNERACQGSELLLCEEESDQDSSSKDGLTGKREQERDRDSIARKVKGHVLVTQINLDNINVCEEIPEKKFSYSAKERAAKNDSLKNSEGNSSYSGAHMHQENKKLQMTTQSGYSLREKGQILIVDDNPFNLLVGENIIKSLGYPVKLAKSGHEAIDLAKAYSDKGSPFHLILMDCQMPIIDGFETTLILKKMMENSEISPVPIVALTAINSEEDIKRCYECGMMGHLLKPLFRESLLEILAKFS